MKRRVVILCNNGIDFDQRVRREAETLARAGFEVRYLASGPSQSMPHGLAVGLGYQALRAPERVHGPWLAERLGALGLERELMDLGVYGAAPTLAPRLFDLVASGLGDGLSGRAADLALRGAVLAYRALGGKHLRRALRPSRASSSAPVVVDVEADRRAILGLIAGGLALVEPALAFRPDVVLAIDAPMLPAGVALARLSGAALAYDAHEIFHAQSPEDTRSSLWTSTWRAIEQRLIPLTDARFTVGDDLGSYMKTVLGTPPFTTLYNAPHLHIAEAARARQMPTRPFRATYHGLLFAHRGLETVARAAKLVASESQIRFIGGGSFEPTLRELAGREALAIGLVAAVPYGQLIDTLAHEDAGIIPIPDNCLNHRFTLPNKFYEAMMAGLPLIVAPRAELARHTRQHELGIIVESETPAGYASAVDVLASSPARWRAFRNNAVHAAERHFNWAREEPKLIEAIGALSQGPGLSACPPSGPSPKS